MKNGVKQRAVKLLLTGSGRKQLYSKRIQKTKRRQIIIKGSRKAAQRWKGGILTVLEDKTGKHKGTG